MMSNEGLIEAVPGLRAMHPDAKMSHEASIGRIAPGEVSYLQSKGLTEEEAISMIVRGFLDIGIRGLSSELDAAISEIMTVSGHGEK
jgi:Fe-S cluster assembly scaffold protein SufB